MVVVSTLLVRRVVHIVDALSPPNVRPTRQAKSLPCCDISRFYDLFTTAVRAKLRAPFSPCHPPPPLPLGAACDSRFHTYPQVESEYELAEKARLRKQAAREKSSGGGAASATLAQRLLQGWAMLSTTCPEAGCHNPLMRDRNGKEQCVSCSGAKAAAPSTPRQEVAAGAAAATVPAQAAGDFAGEMETEDEEDQALLDDGAGRMYAERRMEELLSVSAGGAAAGTGRAVKSDAEGGAVDRSRIQSQALDTLYRALDSAQQRLRACSSSVGVLDIDESVRQADLIAKLAVATRAVSELPSGS